MGPGQLSRALCVCLLGLVSPFGCLGFFFVFAVSCQWDKTTPRTRPPHPTRPPVFAPAWPDFGGGKGSEGEKHPHAPEKVVGQQSAVVRAVGRVSLSHPASKQASEQATGETICLGAACETIQAR